MEHLFYEEVADENQLQDFSPDAIGDLVVWLDSRDVAASPVALWPDRSANGYDATQSVAARKPVTGIATAPGGSQLVSFDGSPVVGQEDYLDGIIPNGDYPDVTRGYTFVFAGNLKTCRKPPAGNASYLFDGQTANAPLLMSEDGNFTHKYAFDDSLGQKEFSAFSAGDQILSFVWSPGVGAGPSYTGTVKLYKDGSLLGTKAYTLDTSGVSNYRIGDSISGAGYPSYMDLAAFVWFRRALDADDREGVEQWIRDEFGY